MFINLGYIRRFLLLLCLSFASCTHFDTGYQNLLSQAAANPNPAEIVGMWHRKSGPETSGQVSSSLLFKSDGTGLSDFYHADFLLGREYGKSFRWSYQGGGVWLTQGSDLNGIHWRLTGNKLLMENHQDWRGQFHFVWERVQE